MIAILFYTGWLWGIILSSRTKMYIFSATATIWLILHAGIPFFPIEWILPPAIALGMFCNKKMPKKWRCIVEEQTKISSILKSLLVLLIVVFIVSIATPYHVPRGHYSQSTAIAKEAASMLNGTYSTLKFQNKAQKTTGVKDLLEYMNFLAIDISSSYGTERPFAEPSEEGKNDILENGWWPPLMHWIKQWNSKPNELNPVIKGTPLQPCSRRLQCLKLHNGGIVQFDTQQTFGGTANTNAIFFNLDPDGHGPEGRVSLYQYFDGGITTGETKRPNTQTSTTTLTSQDEDPKYAPKWQ